MKWIRLIIPAILVIMVLWFPSSTRRAVEIDDDFWISQIEPFKGLTLADIRTNEVIVDKAPILNARWNGVKWLPTVLMTNEDWERLQSARKKKTLLYYHLLFEADMKQRSEDR